jgi:hypothetical protein
MEGSKSYDRKIDSNFFVLIFFPFYTLKNGEVSQYLFFFKFGKKKVFSFPTFILTHGKRLGWIRQENRLPC